MRAASLRILLIDDNRHGLVARRTVLQEMGHKVEIASSGQDGIDLFQSEPFDLVITDYRMPGLNGQQVIRKLRQHQAKVPILLLSGYVDALGLDETTTGADLVLSKGPGEVQELQRAVIRLGKKRLAPKPPASDHAPRARTRAAKKGG